MAERVAMIEIARDVDEGIKVSFASNTENDEVICGLYLYYIGRVCICLSLD